MKKFIQLLIILILSSAYGYNLDFFEKFNDEYLENYIKEALLCNHTLKEAQAKSQQFRYEVKSTLSEEFPSLSVAGNYLGIHLPNNDFGNLLQKNSFILPFFVNWELDLLLKTKDKIKSKKHLYLAQKNNQDSVYISLLTDITSCYINILLFDYLIEKQEKIIDIEANNLVLDEKKLKWGAINFTDFNSRKEDLTTKEIALETLLKKRKELLYNFSQLIGRSAYSKEKIKRGSIQTFEYIEKIPEEINVDVIYKRPDIAEIENKLKASKLDVTVAKKDFFPTFKITGLLGFDTTSGGNFFSWNSSFAYLLLGATQDIFKGGQKLANLKIKKS
ncbi:TolC family protein, partial [bacterium]|nr:TolC family protein [bacterium]